MPGYTEKAFFLVQKEAKKQLPSAIFGQDSIVFLILAQGQYGIIELKSESVSLNIKAF